MLTSKMLLAKEKAEELMRLHGLEGWRFEFNRAKVRSAFCRAPFGDHPGVISLSKHYCELNGEADIVDTILHEIAHALVGPERGHDEAWRRKCVEIGARPEPYYSDRVRMPKGRWHARCKGCGCEWRRHRKPKPLEGWSCAECGEGIVWSG